MRTPFLHVSLRTVVIAASAISLLLVGGGWLWSYIALRGARTPLILRFNDLSGISQIGGVRELAGIGTLGLAIVAIDSALALALVERDRVMSCVLALGGVFVSGLIFIAFAVIISVN